MSSTVRTAFDEIKGIVRRTSDNLLQTVGFYGRHGEQLRYSIGDLNAHLARYIADGTFANRLLTIFKLATSAGITLEWMDRVIKGLLAERAVQPDPSGFEYTYNGTTIEPPEVGELRFDVANAKLWVSDTTAPGKVVRNAFSVVHTGDTLYIQDNVYRITGERVGKYGYTEFPVALIGAGGDTPVAGQRVLLGFKTANTILEAILVVENCLVFALAQEARIIRATKYKSRDDVERVLKRMKGWFDIMADLSADSMANPNYLAFVNMAGAITRYLADEARPLPRMIELDNPPWPTLVISQYVYGEGDRSEELIAENKIVHPLFCRADLRGLSA